MSGVPQQSRQIGPLMDEFVGRFRRGERPSVTEYVERHPDLANEIRELFPALVMMEQAGSEADGLGDAVRGVTADGRALEQLGDYRVLREIGRGGMGIVYEAEQQSKCSPCVTSSSSRTPRPLRCWTSPKTQRTNDTCGR